MIKKLLVLSIMLAVVLMLIVSAQAQNAPTEIPTIQVPLTWDANTESDLDGYRIHFGSQSGVYGKSVDVGMGVGGGGRVGHTVELPAGTWYIAVTAYDKTGNESGYSNQLEIPIVIVIIPEEDIEPPSAPKNLIRIITQ